MKQFLLEMLHGAAHLLLPILDRIHRPTSNKVYDVTARWAFGDEDVDV